MLVDRFGRKITYLRISVTDRCNYRCVYCMPEEGVELKPHAEMLSYEDMINIASAAVELGITKIRLTGGEPLIKRNIEFLVSSLAQIKGIDDLTMTTNGSLLTVDKARDLQEAGLQRVNISLDTLDPKVFRKLTRGGDVRDVLKGIDAAKRAGLNPIKINMVIFADTSEDEISAMRDFCRSKGLRLQTIMQFSLYDRKRTLPVVTDRPPPCSACNRLRLTADGYFLPCLFSDKELKVDLADIKASILAAVRMKPKNGVSCRNRSMPQIGG